MAIRFITGKTKSGKTNYLYEGIIERSMTLSTLKGDRAQEKLLIIVPEQSTLEVQHKIIEQHPNHCITNIEILSFGRLAHRMVDELGIAGKTVISDVGKNMMISRIVNDDESGFPFLSKNIHKNGYVNELRDLMSEFSRYTLESEDFSQIMAQVDDQLLKLKLEDCKKLFERYNEQVQSQYFSGDTMMDMLVEGVADSPFLRNTRIYIDGFYGYTPIQYRLIERLMTTVKNLTVTVTIDNNLLRLESLDENHLYYESHETYKRLKAIVAEHGHLLIKDVPMDCVLQHEPLGHLRDYLYQYPYKPYSDKVKGVYLSKVTSLNKEVAYVRDSILKLVMDNQYRFRDIAVVSGDVNRYDKVLSTLFQEGQVPYYIDQKKSILSNDVANFVLSIVKIMQYDFAYKDVFAYFKSGYIDADIELVDYMENYVLRYGIRGSKRYEQQWTLRVPDIHTEVDSPVAIGVLEQINGLKDSLVEPLMTYRSKKPKTIKEHVKALFEFLEVVGLEAQITAKAKNYEVENKLNLHREYSQIYSVIMNLLEELYEISLEEKMTYEGFAKLIESGFEEIEIGNVPARLDEVLIGDLTRTHLADKKAIFVIGMNEGVIPKLKEGTSLLTDQERDLMDSKGFSLAPSAKKSLFRDQFYIYLKLISASEKLYLSYALINDEGGVVRAAHLVHMIKKLLPSLSEINIDEIYEERIIINTPEAVYSEVMKALQEGNEEQIKDLIKWYNREESYKDRLDKAISGRGHHKLKDSLSQGSTSKLYGKTLLNSVSRLEQFSRCPFAHFARYGLKASEREAYEITMPQLGLVFHRVIELFSKRVLERELSWSDITEVIREAWVEEMVDHTLVQDTHGVFFDSERNKYRIKRLKQILSKTIKVIAYQISQGVFEPLLSEWQFKGEDKDIKALNIPLEKDKSMCLMGTIDRVDSYEDGDLKYITIVDYKSSNQDFDLGDMYHGLQLQLIVYLNAAVEVTAKGTSKEVRPAGVFYFKIDDPFVEGYESMSAQSLEKDLLKKFRLKGVVVDEEEVIQKLDGYFTKESAVIPVKRNANGTLSKSSKTLSSEGLDTIRTYIHNKTKELGDGIVGGQIAAKPFKKKEMSACDYCEYNGICGFDRKLPGHEYNILRASNDSYIDLMHEENEKANKS